MKKEASKIDIAGIICSFICAVHCFSLPAIALMSPMLSSYFHDNPVIHIILFILASSIAYLAFAKSKGSRLPLKFGCFGLLCLFCGIILEIFFHEGGETFAIGFNICGGILLIIAHWINLKSLKISN